MSNSKDDALTEDEQEKILEWFKEHSRTNAPPNCPVCQYNDWAVENTLHAINEIEKEGNRLQVKEAGPSGAHIGKILVTLICQNYGHTLLFEAQKIGIV